MQKTSFVELNNSFAMLLEKKDKESVCSFLDLLISFEITNITSDKKANRIFHQYNTDSLKSAKENIENSIDSIDAIVYSLAFLIYRYQAILYNTIIGSQFREWFEKIGEPSLDMNLFAFFAGKQIGNIQQVVFNIAGNIKEQRIIRETYLLTRALLFDDEFLTTEVLYKNEKHFGFYFLYDMLSNEIARFMDKPQPQQWKLAFKNYCFKHNNVKQFYKDLSILQYTLSFFPTETDTVKQLLSEVDLLPMDKLNDIMTLGDATLLYSMQMMVLSNLSEYEAVSKTCDDILGWIKTIDYKNRWFFEYVCRCKFEALDKLDDKNKNKFFFDFIKDFEIDKIGNLVFLMPQLTNSSEDETVYHYSDVSALKSMIDNKQLWLTRYDYLNDTEEVKFTYKIIKKYVDESSSGVKDEFKNYLSQCVDLLSYYFDENLTNLDKMDSDTLQIVTEIKKSISSIYVLSTSTDGDNLSLWHYYSGGTGANIQFKAKTLKQEIELSNSAVRQMTANIFMNRIDYLESTDNSDIISKLNKFYADCNDLQFNQKLYLGCINILFEGIFKKNANMRQETEYRIALIVPSHSDDTVNPTNLIKEKFRVKSNSLVMPYMELSIEPIVLIEGIKIAPLNKTDIAKRGLVDFLRSKGYKEPEKLVSLSDIRLRY